MYLLVMHITKSKSYSNISLADLKQDLKIYDNESDAELSRLIKTAVSIAEKYVGGDIVPTANVLEDYCINGCYYSIGQPNVTVGGVSGTTDNTTTQITGYTIYRFQNYTLIKFNNSVSLDRINVAFTSGFSTIPHDIRQAITIKVGELFDADKSGYVNNTMKPTMAFNRILTPYINL